MHNDHRYSQLSSNDLRTRRQCEKKFNYRSTANCCLFTRTLTRGPDGDCSFNVEEIFGLGLSLFENKRTI